MTQGYAASNSDKIKGQILMGSVLLRSHRTLNDEGKTVYDYPVPTLTLGGTKDGLMRVTRVAESFWHSHVNIDDSQKGKFPVVALDGVSHMGYLSGEPPSAVKKRDLKSEVSPEQGYNMIASEITSFVDNLLNDSLDQFDEEPTAALVEPILKTMYLEGYSNLKPPCYASNLLNPTDDPKCTPGSPFNEMYS